MIWYDLLEESQCQEQQFDRLYGDAARPTSRSSQGEELILPLKKTYPCIKRNVIKKHSARNEVA